MMRFLHSAVQGEWYNSNNNNNNNNDNSNSNNNNNNNDNLLKFQMNSNKSINAISTAMQ